MKTAEIDVEFIDSMGDDKRVVESARVSFNAKDEEYSEARCESLISFLARGIMSKEYNRILSDMADEDDLECIKALVQQLDKEKHFAPFTHCMLTFKITAPLFLARQLWKSHIGGHMSEPVLGEGWSEVSRRYVDDEPEFYVPKDYRNKAENVKQGSSDQNVDGILYISTDELGDVHGTAEDAVTHALQCSLGIYQGLLSAGVCAEQARIVLPQNMMTSWVWTGSLLFFTRICKLRLDAHAQKENKDVALPIYNKLLELFPLSTNALLGNINE